MGYSVAKDLTGLKVGLLTVVSKDSIDKHCHLRWLCQCVCGNTTVVQSSNLLRNHTQSCGNCLTRKKHSMAGTHPYGVWTQLRYRCTKPDHPNFHQYGGGGILVCARWDASFENFWEDMKAEYKPGLYIDRKNNDGNYEPDNCRWVSSRVSVENRRSAVLITFEGEVMNVSEAARRSGIEYGKLRHRLKRCFPEDKLFFKGNFDWKAKARRKTES